MVKIYNPINYSVQEKLVSNQVGRKKSISKFYEDDKAAHYFSDYKQHVERYPNLFANKKTEFTKFQNAIPSSKLILRSSSFGRGSQSWL